MKFVIQGRLDSLNEYIKSCRGNIYSANNMKKRNQKAIREAIRIAKLKPIYKYPISLRITWKEPNSRRDIDNIQFATKFILDAMVEMKIIKNDSQKYVTSINHEVLVDRDNPQIEVEIIEGS